MGYSPWGRKESSTLSTLARTHGMMGMEVSKMVSGFQVQMVERGVKGRNE